MLFDLCNYYCLIILLVVFYYLDVGKYNLKACLYYENPGEGKYYKIRLEQ